MGSSIWRHTEKKLFLNRSVTHKYNFSNLPNLEYSLTRKQGNDAWSCYLGSMQPRLSFEICSVGLWIHWEESEFEKERKEGGWETISREGAKFSCVWETRKPLLPLKLGVVVTSIKKLFGDISEAEVLTLHHHSRILRHCWGSLEFLLSCFAFWIQHLSTEYEERQHPCVPANRSERQCWLLIHPSKVWESYPHALEQGLLFWRWQLNISTNCQTGRFVSHNIWFSDSLPMCWAIWYFRRVGNYMSAQSDEETLRVSAHLTFRLAPPDSLWPLAID